MPSNEMTRTMHQVKCFGQFFHIFNKIVQKYGKTVTNYCDDFQIFLDNLKKIEQFWTILKDF